MHAIWVVALDLEVEEASTVVAVAAGAGGGAAPQSWWLRRRRGSGDGEGAHKTAATHTTHKRACAFPPNSIESKSSSHPVSWHNA